jgi:hypothetical protein
VDRPLPEDPKFPSSPFQPLLSLFYKTVYIVFAGLYGFGSAEAEDPAKKQAAAVTTLSVLACGLEHYGNLPAFRVVFPLFMVILTFYNALTPDHQAKLALVIFCHLRECADPMRRHYSILHLDARPRVFELVTSLWSLQRLESASQASRHPLGEFVDEAVSRTIPFLAFFKEQKSPAPAELAGAFGVFVHLLATPMSRRSIHTVLVSLADLVTQFSNALFRDRTVFLHSILLTLVSSATRAWDGQPQVLGFILWLVEREGEVRPSMTRSRLSIEYAVCVATLSSETCVPFWSHLPKELEQVRDLYDRLHKAKNAGSPHQLPVREMLKMYAISKSFPAIRAQVGEYVLRINEENGDYLAAFMAQWELAAFVADALKLRGGPVPGLRDKEEFPFAAVDKDIDIARHAPDSAHFVLESQSLTVESLGHAMRHAIELAQKVGLHTILGPVSRIVRRYFCVRREFTALEDLDRSLADSCAAVETAPGKPIGFVRMSFLGKAAEQGKCTHIIMAFSTQDRTMEERVNDFCVGLFGQGNFVARETPEFLSSPPIQNLCLFTRVSGVRKEVEALTVRHFRAEVITGDKGWKTAYAKRYNFETDQPLPAPLSIVNVTKSDIVEMSKLEYYRTKLGVFADKLDAAFRSVKGIFPSPLCSSPVQSMFEGVTPRPILTLLRKIRHQSTESSVRCAFLRRTLFSPPAEGTPDTVVELVKRIEVRLRKCIELCEKFSEKVEMPPADLELVQFFRKESPFEHEVIPSVV